MACRPLPLRATARFAYHQTMDAEAADEQVASIAAAIGVPARARMLYGLMDGRARTSTELAAVADVTPATASTHLQRLKALHLVTAVAQGRHRYYRLGGEPVAAALESLSVLAGASPRPFVPSTPHRLRAARTCYDHIAGTLGVALLDRLTALEWLAPPPEPETEYRLTPGGTRGLASLGLDLEAARASRRRFAYACLDWSERRPHLGGALAAALLALALERRWVRRDLEGRALEVTRAGRRELEARLGVTLAA